MATEIQTSMLPSIFPAFPQREEFDLYASMDPAKEVGGDFYDFFMIDDDHLGVVIADVSGKGVPAALFMMISKTIVQNYAKLGISASEVLIKANQALCAQNKMEMFVTTWIGILEISTGKMNCSSAGHEYPALCHDGKYELFRDRHGLVLGGMDMARYRDYEIVLEKGDKIFVYTDGVPEATNTNNEMFGTDRMIDALNIDPGAAPETVLKNVRAAVDEFVGSAEQFDDLTMVCLEYKK
jgi:sigma-B regulation protein RsbU (phosphoserine phosphatase)